MNSSDPLFEQLVQRWLVLPYAAQIILALIAIPWLLAFLDIFFRGGIRNGLKLNPSSPLPIFAFYTSTMVHRDWKHLRANTPPLLLLGAGTLLSGTDSFWLVTHGVILLTGVGLWLFSSKPVLGASGLIAGYFGYLLTQMIISPEYIDLAVGVIVAIAAVFWVGLRQLFGMFISLKADDGISRLGHSLGLLAGIATGVLVWWVEQTAALAA